MILRFFQSKTFHLMYPHSFMLRSVSSFFRKLDLDLDQNLHRSFTNFI